MMIIVHEAVEVLEIENDDFIRVRGKPIGNIQKRLANLRAIQTVKEVHVLASWFRSDAQIEISDSAIELLLDIVALCNRPI